jgi:hypothetical protein
MLDTIYKQIAACRQNPEICQMIKLYQTLSQSVRITMKQGALILKQIVGTSGSEI